MTQQILVTERTQIGEVHVLTGAFPVVESYGHIDVDLLYQNDAQPFHVTLRILERGRVSRNGLLYDDELVNRILEQMLEGMGGIVGHLGDNEMHKYPLDEVVWVGHSEDADGVIWAKMYVPPGDLREHVRRKKATGGKIGTSIYGTGIREALSQNTWRVREFDLESIDIVHAKNASLQMGGMFTITKETVEEGVMPDEAPVTPVAEAVTPQPDQIAERDNRIRELEGQLATANTTVAEMREYAAVIGQLRVSLGEDADIIAVVAEMQTAMEMLRERLNTAGNVSISVALDEYFSQVEATQASLGEMTRSAFERGVDDAIAEMTQWRTSTEASKKQLAAFRQNFRRTALAEMADRDSAKIKETLNRLWDGEFKPLAEGLLKAMAGPAAFVGGHGESAGKTLPTNEELAAMGSRYLPGKGN